MNSQSYRIKLEAAIEQRDQLMLAELERIAADSPATKRLWEDHSFLEQAIEAWVNSPASVDVDSMTTSLPKAMTEGPRNSRRTRSSVAAISGIACLLLFSWIATSGNQTETVSHQLTAQTDPAAQADPTAQNPGKQKQGPFTQVSHSYDLVDQGRALLPSVMSLPVIPEVTIQVAQEVTQTWERISVLPDEMQQVWKQLNLPTTEQQGDESLDQYQETPAHPETPQIFSLFKVLS
ncbi:MAG: hypothetical protein JKY95_08840 [Planctomycetaceae bacterium]|nr:hypothetical protein [Planctomycetaceae bacterium]